MEKNNTPVPVLNAIFTVDSFVIEALDPVGDPWIHSWKEAFDRNRYDALFALGFEEKPQMASATFHWLYLLSTEFLQALTNQPGLELTRDQTQVTLSPDQCRKLLYSLPFGLGTEYVNEAWIEKIFSCLTRVFDESIACFDGPVSTFLTEKGHALRVPERVFFHLVENRKEAEAPFAFLATYATKLPDGTVRHMPLSYALVEYKGQRDRILSLLSCLDQAGEICPLIGQFIETGELFHPLKLSADEAYTILKCVHEIEQTGILCRVPAWWKKQASTVQLEISLGEDKPAFLGFNGIISMQPSLVVDGVRLTPEEIQQLLNQTEGLALLKGKWVEINHGRLKELLQQMEEAGGEITLLEALRMQAGLKDQQQGPDADVGPLITNGTWLGDLLYRIRQPNTLEKCQVPPEVHATLRPYQDTGFSWLDYMHRLGFGACLADDMGLGKTLQVLTFLQLLFNQDPKARVLLVAPASLLGNWEKEIEKFTPALPHLILHGLPGKQLNELLNDNPLFLSVTTYGMVSRMKELQNTTWTCLILDEAQAIKNPGTQQTRSIKKLKAQHRIAMTGTPIENELANLWSLFDFLNKGLLGTSNEFRDFTKQLEKNSEGYQKLKNMIAPFILRRLKTDKSIISDLPDKMEQIDYVQLSRKQVILYRNQVSDLERKIQEADGLQRRGLILAAITKLKQICNHPDEYLGQDAFAPEESGKFTMLRDLCETIYEKRERVLVFTQYREVIDALSRYLASIFGRPGLTLHGGTPVKKRAELVEQFNGNEYVPFMILSVKAGGTGLNLTSANHVIHFDRWWNPAVENQATDRAFRIGQQKNVIVHKLVSTGTIEEKIDAMINSKKDLAENVIGSGGENWITELSDQEVLSLMRLEA